MAFATDLYFLWLDSRIFIRDFYRSKFLFDKMLFLFSVGTIVCDIKLLFCYMLSLLLKTVSGLIDKVDFAKYSLLGGYSKLILDFSSFKDCLLFTICLDFGLKFKVTLLTSLFTLSSCFFVSSSDASLFSRSSEN